MSRCTKFLGFILVADTAAESPSPKPHPRGEGRGARRCAALRIGRSIAPVSLWYRSDSALVSAPHLPSARTYKARTLSDSEGGTPYPCIRASGQGVADSGIRRVEPSKLGPSGHEVESGSHRGFGRGVWVSRSRARGKGGGPPNYSSQISKLLGFLSLSRI